MHPYTNRLAEETSPYLLQHAHNPVDWYPWGEEAFELAVRENKPVLVSIGYAACHWCHVMERESFEDPEVAQFMNTHFVNIKVDREERPDVDHMYMDAVQAISGSGGWPLNVFLTPDKRPFYGGTYYPPRRAFNRASWMEVLQAISKSFHEQKEEVEEQASQLTRHLEVSNSFGAAKTTRDIFSDQQITEAFRNVMKNADREWGGFGAAPKFPQSFTITFLLRYAHIREDNEALQQAKLSLDKMIQGGIYDQIGGGFARYSTDAQWLAPHFEKMLYDNALLVITLSEAFQLTKDNAYKVAIEETLQFVEKELQHPEHGFFSALDADSEGEEGKFYVWEKAEVEQLLGKEAAIFCDYYDIREGGNWEGKSIPRVLQPLEAFAQQHQLDPNDLQALLAEGKEKLFRARENRVRPGLDDKVLLGWNALMNLAYARAFAATGNQHYREVAIRNMSFLMEAYRSETELLLHSWKMGKARHPAFLDDYSYLIAALIELVQVTGDFKYLDEAEAMTETVIRHFADEESSFFFFTHKEQKDIPVRKKEVYDGATPSGNATMAYNLYRLSILLDRSDWRDRVEEMMQAWGDAIIKYPTSFGIWLQLLFEINSGTAEIALVGKEWKKYLEKTLGIYISHKLALATEDPIPRYPLVADKAGNSKILIYLCKNYACRTPVNTIQDLVTLLQRKEIFNTRTISGN